jgi:Tol biopolymer transport system component
LSSPGQFNTQPPSALISPDGHSVAFVAADASGHGVLWVRDLRGQEPRALEGTSGADQPAWSPDSRSLAFVADSALKVAPLDGGAVRTLTHVAIVPGITWNQQGTILFGTATGALASIGASGGPIAALGDASAGRMWWPHFLPDGRHFLYYSPNSSPGPGVYVGAIDSHERKRLLDSEFEATYAAPGYLLFVRDETLLAQPFDLDRLELRGAAAPVATGVWVARGYGHGVFSASTNGVLVYVNAAIGNTQLTWFDRHGRQLGTIGPPARYDAPPQLSASGDVVAVARGPFAQQDIWLLRADGESRFTFDHGSRVPVWSKDRTRIFYQSHAGDGTPKLFAKAVDGGGNTQRIGHMAGLNLQDVSPDGRSLVYMLPGGSGHFELWVASPSGDGEPTPFLQTAANNGQAQISPDGHWIAYTSNESGREEVYVQSFPMPGSKHQVSIDGGAQPRWRRAGDELYFLAPDHALMTVPIRNGAAMELGTPVPLFRAPLEYLALQGPLFMPGYDVSSDGQRFLLNAPPSQGVSPIDVVLNWPAIVTRQ